MDLSTIFQVASGGIGSGSLLVVLWMVATGKLVPGSVHDEMREDRNFYRSKFTESATMLGRLLSSVEVEE